jgi:hypothetical protein
MCPLLRSEQWVEGVMGILHQCCRRLPKLNFKVKLILSDLRSLLNLRVPDKVLNAIEKARGGYIFIETRPP